MINLTRYKWFKYEGKIVELATDHPEYNIEIHPGDKFAYKKIGANHYVVLRTDMDFRFKLKVKDAERIINNSAGWSGKIKGNKVEAGVGGKDKPNTNTKDIYELQIDSSNLKKAWYDKKEKELHVVFHNDAHWAYEEVTLRQAKALENAESQGRYFIYKIRNVKPQYKVSG